MVQNAKNTYYSLEWFQDMKKEYDAASPDRCLGMTFDKAARLISEDGLPMTTEDVKRFDENNDGSINFEEYLTMRFEYDNRRQDKRGRFLE
ncbi:uncharacterized protein BP01DRAFT_387912 [Aspergillus saccharolyticus JOP 1030-1]|uniref:EF-hand domain-containing protein n=1 Tax=Aspergillus saccharolyticus JOP 1030-1 TaxID=1450539 RepID=A0A319AE61_9EURO|nr:hypothetical protein BP01DRAFT_387912 [Aspergillus saccharolyticus JOP 1030-1]PYH49758.1 hypothetical protein BP01DRAFT_387912 [Aspergillus saccharolyticus JOP 1030-1]